MLYKRRWLILAITAAGIAGGIFISMMTRPEYSGTVMVQVARRGESAQYGRCRAGRGGTRFDSEFYATQYALLKSRSLSELVA